MLTWFPLLANGQPVDRFDVVITELFPDPGPAVGLPSSEFIELKNVSDNAVSLRQWKISDGSTTATIGVDFLLQPDSMVIICPNAAVSSFRAFGNTIGVSGFPSLNNEADQIAVYSADGKMIHMVSYTLRSYQNDIKSEGGWTLEMMDPKNPCASETNYKASTDPAGGTPGRINSVHGTNPDDLPPALIRTYSPDSTTIVAVFDELLDSATASDPKNYRLDNDMEQPEHATLANQIATEVILHFTKPLQPGTVYQLQVMNVCDCAGNAVASLHQAPAGLPSLASANDIVINEILFNPLPNSYDYVELYNRSAEIVDLKQLFLANQTATGSLRNIVALSPVSALFFPGQYLALTENKEWLLGHYIMARPETVLELTSLPSMPDDKGNILLFNAAGQPVDALHYDQNWHFPLLAEKEGIALERIHYNDSTNKPQNWMSAAAGARFGTPGYKNSQFRADVLPKGSVNVAPTIFSPDHSGTDDYTTIYCSQLEPGHLVNITVFDAAGRPVRYLAKNAVSGTDATFRWDGLNEQRAPLAVGNYIIFTEIFNSRGNVKKFKHVVTLARAFQ